MRDVATVGESEDASRGFKPNDEVRFEKRHGAHLALRRLRPSRADTRSRTACAACGLRRWSGVSFMESRAIVV